MNTRELAGWSGPRVAGHSRGYLELSDCLRHCLDEDDVVNAVICDLVGDMATSLSLGGMRSEGAGGRRCSTG